MIWAGDMKLLNDRLKKLEKNAGTDQPNLAEFRMVDGLNAEGHKAEMLANGYRLVRDQDGFQVWDGPY